MIACSAYFDRIAFDRIAFDRTAFDRTAFDRTAFVARVAALFEELPEDLAAGAFGVTFFSAI